jgi:hypothetical protein
MSKRNAPLRRTRTAISRPRMLAGIALAGITGLAANSLWGREKAQKDTSKDKEFSVTVQGPETDAGLIVSARATAKEVGLPIYPGSIPHKDQDKDNDSPAAKLGLWSTSFGFKLVVLKMEVEGHTEESRRLLSEGVGQVRDGSRLHEYRPGSASKGRELRKAHLWRRQTGTGRDALQSRDQREAAHCWSPAKRNRRSVSTAIR